MLRNKDQCAKFDLSSVSNLYTGAAPLGPETVDEYLKIYPSVTIKQAYGLTETSTVVCSTHPKDFFLGSSGCLIPGAEVRILSPEGQEITSYDTPGELVVRSPSVVLGYLNNDKATKETFRDGWMHTGDEAVVRQNPETKSEHIFIVDRIKELIKVKVCTYHRINNEVEQQLTVRRACKSPPPNSKPTSSPTPPSPTAPSSPSPTTQQAKSPGPSSSSLLKPVPTMRQPPKRSRSTSRSTRLVTSGSRAVFGSSKLFPRALVGRFCGDCLGTRRKRLLGGVVLSCRFLCLLCF